MQPRRRGGAEKKRGEEIKQFDFSASVLRGSAPPRLHFCVDRRSCKLPATMETDRKQHLSTVRTLVIKLGTQLLSANDGQLDVAYLSTIAEQVAALRERG